jgi:TolB-like protein
VRVEAWCAYNCTDALRGALAAAGLQLVDPADVRDDRPFFRLDANMDSGVAIVQEVRPSFRSGAKTLNPYEQWEKKPISQITGWVSGSSWSRNMYQESAVQLTNAFVSSPQIARRLTANRSYLAALQPEADSSRPTSTVAVKPPRAESGGVLAASLSLAVLEFATSQDAKVDRLYFSDLVRSAAVKQLPSISVMTRENLEVLLKAQRRLLDDCDSTCEVETGRRLGADFVVSGRISRVGSRLTLIVHLYATTNGRLLASEEARGRSVDELVAAAERSLPSLFASLAMSGE